MVRWFPLTRFLMDNIPGFLMLSPLIAAGLTHGVCKLIGTPLFWPALGCTGLVTLAGVGMITLVACGSKSGSGSATSFLILIGGDVHVTSSDSIGRLCMVSTGPTITFHRQELLLFGQESRGSVGSGSSLRLKRVMNYLISDR